MDFIEDDSDEENDSGSNSMTITELDVCARPSSCGTGAFHEGTEEAMLIYVNGHATKGDPESVLRAVDKYCYSRHWMMHIGDVKGVELDFVVNKVLKKNSPHIVVELGTYCGYSIVRMGRYLSPDDMIICIDNCARALQWTQKLVEFAEIKATVVYLCGTATQVLEQVKQACSVKGKGIDLLFIDHDKAQYLNDLLVFEESGLLVSGSTVLADNVLSFGVPKQDYLDHVRSSHFYASSQLIESTLEYSASGMIFAINHKERFAPLLNHDFADAPCVDLMRLAEKEAADCSDKDGLEWSIVR